MLLKGIINIEQENNTIATAAKIKLKKKKVKPHTHQMTFVTPASIIQTAILHTHTVMVTVEKI